jgi:hypothetical protein
MTTSQDHQDPHDPKDRPLLSMRTALILMIALFVGFAIGALTFCSDQSLPKALLAGLGAAGVVVLPLNKAIRS